MKRSGLGCSQKSEKHVATYGLESHLTGWGKDWRRKIKDGYRTWYVQSPGGCALVNDEADLSLLGDETEREACDGAGKNVPFHLSHGAIEHLEGYRKAQGRPGVTVGVVTFETAACARDENKECALCGECSESSLGIQNLFEVRSQDVIIISGRATKKRG